MSFNERTIIIWSERYQAHATGSHPESPERIVALGSQLRTAGYFDRNPVLAPEMAPLDAVAAVHHQRHITLIQQIAEGGGGWVDPDTYICPDSYDVALLAAGGSIQAVDAVFSRAARAFVFPRPPGHHAEPSRAMGFCLFNNVAIAAKHARSTYGLSRITILDWDVHHGNGTQAIFWRDPGVQYISLHQYPHYPGSGANHEVGEGPGRGYTINVPLSAGSGDADYRRAFDDVVIPAIRRFEPQLLIISAGFDAHRNDPLAMMMVTTDGFAAMGRVVRCLADEFSEGRLVLVLEGGYNLQALGESAVAVLNAIER